MELNHPPFAKPPSLDVHGIKGKLDERHLHGEDWHLFMHEII